MNKTELVEKLAKDLNVSKKLALDMLNTFTDTVIDTVKKGKEVKLTGFGTFRATQRKAREGINPQTLQKIKIPAMKTPTFRAGAHFKQAVKGK